MTKNKKIIGVVAITVASLLLVMLIILGVLFVISELIKKPVVDYTQKQDNISYYSADYSENLEEDIIYASKDKEVFFINSSGFGEYLTSTDAEQNSARGLFYDYFEALKNGDDELHSKLLTDYYKKNYKEQKGFTKQKVYDINVSFLSGYSENDIHYETYSVSYKIRENDGTYRADMGSDVSKTLIFELANTNGKVLINTIVINMS